MPERRMDAGEVVRGVIVGLGLFLFLLPRILDMTGVLDEVLDDVEAFLAKRKSPKTADTLEKAADKYPGSYVTSAGPQLDQHYFVVPDWEPRNCSLDDKQVTAVLHGTLGSLGHLPLLLQRWPGPVDVTVLLASEEEFRILDHFVRLLNDCIPLACLVSFHLLFPSPLLNLPEGQIRDPESFLREGDQVEWLASCQDLFSLGRLSETQDPDSFSLRTLNYSRSLELDSLSRESAELELAYPANLARAVGGELVRTNFVLHLDADVVPSSEAYDGLEEHLTRYGSSLTKEAIGLILPVFEVEETECHRLSSALPRNRADLLAALKASHARPFYSAVNERVHKATDFPRWYRLDSDTSFGRDTGAILNEAYWADWADPYEPYVVYPSAEAPPYDPKFVGYGVNRLSQVCEAFVDGFEFAVLDAAFLLHCGLKTPANAHGRPGRAESLKANQALYRGKFMEEVRKRYKDSERTC